MTTPKHPSHHELELLRDRDIIWIAGRLSDLRPHRHHAAQICWAAPGHAAQLTVSGETLSGSCLMVLGNVEHALDCSNGLVALIDSGRSDLGQVRFGAPWERKYSILDRPVWCGALSERGALLQELGIRAGDSKLDPRLRKVMDWLEAMEANQRWCEVSLPGALKCAALSESRFLHLFSEQVGSPWRSYLVWRRMLVAMSLALAGENITEAAHSAGYSDGAHFARQFKDQFGISPSAIAKNSRFLQA